jgi:hypothetical protein
MLSTRVCSQDSPSPRNVHLQRHHETLVPNNTVEMPSSLQEWKEKKGKERKNPKTIIILPNVVALLKPTIHHYRYWR